MSPEIVRVVARHVATIPSLLFLFAGVPAPTPKNKIVTGTLRCSQILLFREDDASRDLYLYRKYSITPTMFDQSRMAVCLRTCMSENGRSIAHGEEKNLGLNHALDSTSLHVVV